MSNPCFILVSAKGYQFEQTYLIGAGQYNYVQIRANVLGQTFLFDIQVKQLKGRNDDISVLIFDEKNFNNYKKYWSLPSNERTYSRISWNTEVKVRVYWSTITFDPPSVGNYYLVLSNIHSTFTAKTVVIKARIQSNRNEVPALPDQREVPTKGGTIMVAPGSPWTLGYKIDELLKTSQSEILVSSPYVDNTTFTMLSIVADQVKVQLLVSEDGQLSTKVQKARFTSKHVQSILSKKKIEIRRIGNLHARFILADRSTFMFLSSDLQTDSLASKYQLGHWTTSQSTVGVAHELFSKLWTDAVPIDLVTALKEMEDTKNKTPGNEKT